MESSARVGLKNDVAIKMRVVRDDGLMHVAWSSISCSVWFVVVVSSVLETRGLLIVSVFVCLLAASFYGGCAA